MKNQRADDEMVLIDFLRGELSGEQLREVTERLERDESLRKLKGDIANTFEAVGLLPETDPPDDLVETTLSRIRRVRRIEALLAKEESRRLPGGPSFSLRELTLGAAAVIVMAVVLVPSVREARHLAITGRCGSNVGQIGAAMLAYANANNDHLPTVTSESPRWLPSREAGAFSNSAALYKLVRCGYVSHLVFRCPAGGDGTFLVRANMMDFPEDKYISYSYQHSLAPNPLKTSDPKMLRVADKMVILADGTPMFSGGLFRPERLLSPASENHGGRGQNVLYMDMHVTWADRPDVGVGNDNIFLVKGISQYKGDERPAEPTDTFLLPTFAGPGKLVDPR